MTALSKASVRAQDWDGSNASGYSCYCSAAAKIGGSDFVFLAEEAELECAMWATADAVHTHQAFGLAPGNSSDWIVAALAIQQATVALIATGSVFVQAEDGPAGSQSKQSSERTDGTAPEARNAHAGPEDHEKQQAEHDRLIEVGLTKIEHGHLQRSVQITCGNLNCLDMAVFQGDQKGASS